MIRYIVTLVASALLLSPIYAMDARANDTEAYHACKKRAETKKDLVLKEARKEFKEKSELITEKTKRKLDVASWYMTTSFKLQSKKILAEKEADYKVLTDSMSEVRKGVGETLKAELALCERNHPKASTSTKEIKTKGTSSRG